MSLSKRRILQILAIIIQNIFAKELQKYSMSRVQYRTFDSSGLCGEKKGEDIRGLGNRSRRLRAGEEETRVGS